MRDQDWPHESINAVLAGNKFEAKNLPENAFIAGILNSIVTGEEFKKLRRRGNKEMMQKLAVLNELVHTLVRVKNYPQVKEFYYAALEDIETAAASWKDPVYWDTKMAFFRSLARADSSHTHAVESRHEGGGRDRGERRFVRCENICRPFNDNNCQEASPHMLNNVKVFHVCSYCFMKDPVVMDDHLACSCPHKPPGYVRGQQYRGGRGGHQVTYRR